MLYFGARRLPPLTHPTTPHCSAPTPARLRPPASHKRFQAHNSVLYRNLDQLCLHPVELQLEAEDVGAEMTCTVPGVQAAVVTKRERVLTSQSQMLCYR